MIGKVIQIYIVIGAVIALIATLVDKPWKVSSPREVIATNLIIILEWPFLTVQAIKDIKNHNEDDNDEDSGSDSCMPGGAY